MVFALGLGDRLVAVTHECDYPPAAARIPKITRSNIPPGIASRQIDSAVGSALAGSGSLYELDLELLERLQPDLILTQRLCDVCAVSFDRVEQAVRQLKSRPQVVNLEPRSLADILENIRLVARLTGVAERATGLVASLDGRIRWVREQGERLGARPRVFSMEWVDPPYCGGHWMKELVDLAGGKDDLANPERPSYRLEWDRVLEFSPEVIVLACCGFDLARCEQEGEILSAYPGFAELPAARTGRVYATNGSAYFSRPGPRIVDSLEILAHLIHPEVFPQPRLPDSFRELHLAPARAARE